MLQISFYIKIKISEKKVHFLTFWRLCTSEIFSFGVPDMKFFFLLKNAYGAGKACNIMLNHAANEFFHENKNFGKKSAFFDFLVVLDAFCHVFVYPNRTAPDAECRMLQ